MTIKAPTSTALAEHFQAPKGWINDPNGLVYFEGRYHLFYQHHPDGLTWGPMHWGHAISHDLCHWEHKPIALYPDELGMCFSGSAVVDWHDTSGLFNGQPGLVAFYTVHRDKEGFDRGYIQDQCIAYSQDSGETWHKYEHNPVLLNPGQSDFRDPKVFWHDASKHWIMCLASGQNISFYRSTDLLNWSFCSQFGDNQGAHEWHPWECPDLIELETDNHEKAWVLVVGIGLSPDVHFGSYTQYFIGDFDGITFTNRNTPETVLMLDEGRDYYATQSWSDAPHQQRLSISWMNNWRYANDIPASNTRGQMATPRTFKLVNTVSGLRVSQAFFAPVSDALLSVDGRANALVLDTFEHQRLSIDPAVGERFMIKSQDGVHCIEFERAETGFNIRIQRQSDNTNAEVKAHLEHDYVSFLPWSQALPIEYIYSRLGLEILLGDGLMSITQITGTASSLSYE